MEILRLKWSLRPGLAITPAVAIQKHLVSLAIQADSP
jgi:hypothetical protein